MILTIGHSTRPADELIDLLRQNGVTLLVDVRRYPGSRRHPQYGAEPLSRSLRDAGIGYRHEAQLGGRRGASDTHAASDLPRDEREEGPGSEEGLEGVGGATASAPPPSPNAGWRNASFRAYADYMGTPAFRAALDRLVAASREETVAIMCAEAVPWRCHRNLISDALVARGVDVRHITSSTLPKPHELNPMVRVDEAGEVTYPGEEPEQRELF